MNKRSLILMLLCLSVSLPTLAAETEEAKKPWWTEVKAQSDGTAEAVLWYEKDLTPSVGFFALAATDTDRYGAAYAGPYWRPTEWLQLGVGLGRENQPNTVRRAVFYSVDTEKFYSFGVVENGGSGHWYRAHAIYRVNERWSAGVMAERDIGFGPRVEFNPTKDTIVWIATLRGNVPNIEAEIKERKTTLMLGISFSF
ncbi:MAG: hypothetical protein UY89_C0008G0001 [Parcubacteria group bacterium GW2011_GWA1_54_9]|nr:MAG: hypothetical protein UY89_C0008G0001 [Parcubacteria group bacterium GW2011_GWA1_54_9]KKW42058.1 MAG: hypothetical protein UY91_C0007G0002 [Parcubacteria group bacterium GW2011_GWB1_55_9]